MLIVMTSQNAFSLNGQPDPKLIQTLIDTSNAGNPVAIISNHPAPQWSKYYRNMQSNPTVDCQMSDLSGYRLKPL